MNSLIIPIHSFVDLITNSSTEIFVKADNNTINAIKEMIDCILKATDSSLTADDLFEFSLSEEENRYSEWYSSVQMVVKAKQDSFNVNRAAEILSHLRELFSINAEYNS